MNTDLEGVPTFTFFIRDEPNIQLLYDILNEVLDEPITKDSDFTWLLKGEGVFVVIRDNTIATIELFEGCPNPTQLMAKLQQLPFKRVIKKGSIGKGDADRAWYCLDTGEFYCYEGYYDQDIVKYDVEKFCEEEAEDNSEFLNDIRRSCKVPTKPTQYQVGWEEGYKEGLAAAKNG